MDDGSPQVGFVAMVYAGSHCVPYMHLWFDMDAPHGWSPCMIKKEKPLYTVCYNVQPTLHYAIPPQASWRRLRFTMLR